MRWWSVPRGGSASELSLGNPIPSRQNIISGIKLISAPRQARPFTPAAVGEGGRRRAPRFPRREPAKPPPRARPESRRRREEGTDGGTPRSHWLRGAEAREAIGWAAPPLPRRLKGLNSNPHRERGGAGRDRAAAPPPPPPPLPVGAGSCVSRRAGAQRSKSLSAATAPNV